MKFLQGLLSIFSAIAAVFGFLKTKSDDKQAKIQEDTHEKTLQDVNSGKPNSARNRLLKYFRHKSSRSSQD